ncbi:MAG: SDR family oxidoreductase [Chloroflexi bacterium]|nr:SDR family oxidoreductase [Chloroflexota bacterium]
MILVVGSTGLLGGAITRRLLATAQPVRILQRDNPAAQTWIDQGAAAVKGDLRDRASLDAACAGVDVVITTAIARFFDGGDFQSVDLQGTKNLIDAAKAAGAKQFIYTSAYGSTKDAPAELMRVKAEVEEYLKASGVPYTIFQPAVFMEVWIGAVIGIPLQAGQPVTLVGHGNHHHHFIAVDNIAEIAVKAIGNPKAINQMIPIGSTRASWTEIVQMVAHATKRQIPVQYVPIGTPLPLLPDIFNALMWGMETYESSIDMKHWRQVFNVKLDSIEDFARRTFVAHPA